MSDGKKEPVKKEAPKKEVPKKVTAPKSNDAAKPQAKPAAEETSNVKVALDPTLTHMSAAWKYVRPLTACRFDPSGKYVFVGTEDYTVQRIQLSDGALTPLVGHESWVRAIGFTPDAKLTLTGGYDGRLLWWNTADAKPAPLRAVAAHDGWIRALAVSPDGKLVATCGNDRLVKLWNTADGKPVRTLAAHESHVYNLAFHPDGKQLVSCDLKATAKVWNLADGKCERELKFAPIFKYDTTFKADIGGARSLAFGDAGKLLAAGGVTNVTNAFAGIGNAAWVVDLWADGKQKIMHTGKEKVSGMAWGTVWHKAGYWIGAGGGNQGGFLYFFKPEAEAEFFRFKMPDTARDMDLSPDGLTVATAHADGNLRLYRLGPKA